VHTGKLERSNSPRKEISDSAFNKFSVKSVDERSRQVCSVIVSVITSREMVFLLIFDHKGLSQSKISTPGALWKDDLPCLMRPIHIGVSRQRGQAALQAGIVAHAILLSSSSKRLKQEEDAGRIG
jgi:hypothetical protein